MGSLFIICSMGKTIQIIALLVSDLKAPNLVIAWVVSSSCAARFNLLSSPTVAIMQWRNEIAAHTDGLKVLVWHGSSRESNIKEMAKYDVLKGNKLYGCFTAWSYFYQLVASANRKAASLAKALKCERFLQSIRSSGTESSYVSYPSASFEPPLSRFAQLDEAHNIKERSTNTAKATFELKANYRWCLSGTPLQNRVGELYSLVRFLGGDPFSYYFCKKCDCKSLHWRFSDKRSCDGKLNDDDNERRDSPAMYCRLRSQSNAACGYLGFPIFSDLNFFLDLFLEQRDFDPIQKNGMVGPGKIAFKKLKILLDRMMLRRTKVSWKALYRHLSVTDMTQLQRADDLDLPPRTVIVRRDYFSPEEKELYLSLFSDAKRQFNTYLDQGTVLNSRSFSMSLDRL
ncbi:DNA repair protein [Salix suchowensis]|nr:DNA repair protein [Salix suchowensis]